jgi:hypothetical protein
MRKNYPNQRVRILTIQVSVPADADHDDVDSDITELLTFRGVEADDSYILDWQYPTEYHPEVTLGATPYSGEAFHLLDKKGIP